MFPDLFSIHPLTFHTYGLFVAAGFVISLVLTMKVGRFMGISAQLIVDMGVYVILAAIVGSRFMYVMMHDDYFSLHPLDALKIWQGGLVFSGGIVAVLVSLFWYGQKGEVTFWEAGDLWAPGAALGQVVGWIGCFMAGCCYGKPISASWGVVFTNPHALAPVNIPLHPAQLYAAAGGLGITVVLLMLHTRKKFSGQVLLWYLILHSTVSLFVAKYRGDEGSAFLKDSMSASQAITLLMLSGAIVTLVVLKKKERRHETPKTGIG